VKSYYSLLLYPSGPVKDQVIQMKKKLSARIGDKNSSLKAPPHISICSFSLKPGQEKELTASLDGILQSVTAVCVRTAGVSCFSSSGTLFLSFLAPSLYTAIQSQLISELKKKLPSLKRHMRVAATPHLTIGKGLDPLLLEQLSEELQELFTEEECCFTSIGLIHEQQGRMKLFRTWELPPKKS
jgi:2'-5' RNA ligase